MREHRARPPDRDASRLQRQGHRLLQIGVALFLFTSFEGFVIPYFASPQLGRSKHSLAGIFGLILLALGLCRDRRICLKMRNPHPTLGEGDGRIVVGHNVLSQPC